MIEISLMLVALSPDSSCRTSDLMLHA